MTSRILAAFLAAFTQNLGVKLVALVFAVGLFAYLQGQEDLQERTLPANLVLRLPPPSARRELENQLQPSIHVTVRGPARELDRLAQVGLPPVEIDLRDGQVASLNLESSLFDLPVNVQPILVEPATLVFQWGDVVDRSIALGATFEGAPAEGYRLHGQPKLTPATVRVSGPAHLIEVIQQLRLAPFDLSNLRDGNHRRTLALQTPPQRITLLDAPRAVVEVEIVEKTEQVLFERVPVEVMGVARGTSRPLTVSVTVEGPPDAVRALQAEHVVPRADVAREFPDRARDPHGAMAVKISVDLPHLVVNVQPPSVSVRW